MSTESTGLLTPDELPAGFTYPRPLLRVIGLGLVDLDPWRILQGEPLRAAHAALRSLLPGRTLVPFAQMRDDLPLLACFEGPRVVTRVTGEGPAGADYRIHDGFYPWLLDAVRDLALWDTSEPWPDSALGPVAWTTEEHAQYSFDYDEHSDELYTWLDGTPYTGVISEGSPGYHDEQMLRDGRIDGTERTWQEGRLRSMGERRFNQLVHEVEYDEHGRVVKDWRRLGARIVEVVRPAD